ncbi:MAG: hypothetical protein ACI97A_003349 [Planctomycetota bacterium]|jgi:hypothetical protein
MNTTPWLKIAISCAAFALLSVTSFGQICPPTPPGFDGLTGSPNGPLNHNSALLNFITPFNSSNAANMDNVAEAHMGQGIAVQFSDTRVPAGSPFTLAYSIGLKPAPLSIPTVVDGDIWLDVNYQPNFHTIIDGIGLLGTAPDPLGVTPGPNNLINLNVAVTSDPLALGVCVTFQVLVIDPIAPPPYGLAFSNPVLFGIAPVIRGTSPQITAAGTTVTLDSPGETSGDLVIYPQGQTRPTYGNHQVNVPFTAMSGVLHGQMNTKNTIPSNDGLGDYLVVTDQTVVAMPTAGPITLNPDVNLPLAGMSRASVKSSLATATDTSIFTVTLNAGDILDLEVFTTNAGTTKVLDGYGTLINPLAPEGFDPLVTLQQVSNLDSLVWEDPVQLGATGPFDLIADDNSGPVNNARLRWQAKWTDTYNIIVGAAEATGFVTGDFLINMIVTPGAPCVQSFNLTGQPISAYNRVNIVQQGGMVDLICANLTMGNTYTVDFIPKAGAPFTTRSATGVLASASDRLTVALPSLSITSLPIGLHQVRLTDEVTGAQGLIWDNSVYTTGLGVLPDLLCIAGAAVTTATNTSLVNGAVPITNLNSESILFRPAAQSTTHLSAGFVAATDPGGSSIVYAEALGVAENFFLLFDSALDTDAIANNLTDNAIYNPYLRMYPMNLLTVGPVNEDDGILPFPLFPSSMGIGFSAAVVDTFFPLANPAGGLYSFLVDETVVFGPAANHACMVNVVIK